MFWSSPEARAQARKDREWRRLVRQMPPDGQMPPRGDERIRDYVERRREEWPAEAEARGEASPGLGSGLGSAG